MTALRTGYAYHEIFGWHDTGTNAGFFPSDPALGLQPFQNYENADTKRRIHELIVVSKLIDHLQRIPVREATTEELLLVHPQSYLTQLKKTSEQLLGGDAGDGETPLAKGGEKCYIFFAKTICMTTLPHFHPQIKHTKTKLRHLIYRGVF